jgi:hypothetical protein
MNDKTQTINNVKKWPRHAGKNDLLKFLEGKRLTRQQAIEAKCYECVCGEGTEPCSLPKCPLTLYCQWNRVKA